MDRQVFIKKPKKHIRDTHDSELNTSFQQLGLWILKVPKDMEK